MNMPPEHNAPLSQKNKGLLALVIFLGVLIIIATTVLIVVVIGRIMHGRPQTQQSQIQSTTMMSVDRPISVLQEPTGTHIVNVTRQSDQTMVILLSGGGAPDRLVVWDNVHQQKISEIKLAP